MCLIFVGSTPFDPTYNVVIPGEDPGLSKWRDDVAGARICVPHSGMTVLLSAASDGMVSIGSLTPHLSVTGREGPQDVLEKPYSVDVALYHERRRRC